MQFVSLGRNQNAFVAVQRAMMSGRLRTNNLSAALIFEACVARDEAIAVRIARDLSEQSDQDSDQSAAAYLADTFLPLLFDPRLNAAGIESCAFRVGRADPVVVRFDAEGAGRLASGGAAMEIVMDAETLIGLLQDVLARKTRESGLAASPGLYELNRQQLDLVAGGGPCNPDVCVADSCHQNSCTNDICAADLCQGNSCEVDFCAIDMGLPNEN